MEITDDAFRCSRATQMLMETPETVNLQNFIQGTTMNEQISLFMLWMDAIMRQQSNLKLLIDKNLLKLFESTTKLARTGSAWGTESGCSTGEVCQKYFCILLWFLFCESKMDQN